MNDRSLSLDYSEEYLKKSPRKYNRELAERYKDKNYFSQNNLRRGYTDTTNILDVYHDIDDLYEDNNKNPYEEMSFAKDAT